jgi:myo-inositol 2-dehydrogenase/D-chiro-inositol 1-dehydrogenase
MVSNCCCEDLKATVERKDVSIKGSDGGGPFDIDTAVITVRMAGGAIAVINNSRKAVYGYDQRAEIFGSGGAVAISNNASSNAVYSGADGIISEKPLYFFLERYAQSFADEIASFADAIIRDAPVAVNVGDGLAAVRMALAAGRSLAENRPVRMDEI